MKLRRATLIPDTEVPLDDGATIPPPVRAQVRVDGVAMAAIVKRVPPRELAAECLCALLLPAWGVPVPEPLVVEDGEFLCFGSLEKAYPSLKKRFALHGDLPKPLQAKRALMAGAIIAEWDETPLVIAADEAIRNYDRNLGNILWDGDARAYIDHAKALGVDAGPGINKLAGIMHTLGLAARMEPAAVSACFTLAATAVTEAISALPAEWVECRDAFEGFILGRLPSLANQVIACFPKPQQDLFSRPT